MASSQAIVTGLAMLREAYPTRDVTAKTSEVWALLFADVEDTTFLSVCRTLAVERDRKFFPTPGEIMALACPAPPPADVDALLRDIHDLGEYSPMGWRYPGIQSIREALGDDIADAYSDAGAGRCFADADRSGQSVTRDIARREFGKALSTRATMQQRAALMGGTPVPRLTGGPTA